MPSSAVLLIAVGRLVPSKRLDLLLHALHRLGESGLDAYLALVGTGPASVEVTTLAGELGVRERVLLLGRLSDADLHQALGAADILCSASDYEGFGLTLIEGMAAGLPVVATAVGGVTDIVTPGLDGELVAPGDATAIADAVQRLAEPSTLRTAREAARRTAVERFSVADAVGAFERLYASLAPARVPA